MLLLVLSAALFFLLQGKQDLEEELQSSSENIRTLGQIQAQLETDLMQKTMKSMAHQNSQTGRLM